MLWQLCPVHTILAYDPSGTLSFAEKASYLDLEQARLVEEQIQSREPQH
jgi:hypothetical protein